MTKEALAFKDDTRRATRTQARSPSPAPARSPAFLLSRAISNIAADNAKVVINGVLVLRRGFRMSRVAASQPAGSHPLLPALRGPARANDWLAYAFAAHSRRAKKKGGGGNICAK